MKLLPFSKFSIEVDSDEATIREKLGLHVEKFWTNGKTWDNSAAFEGQLNQAGFVIRRHRKYTEGANSFIPVFVGSFEHKNGKTIINITARMFLLTNLFMVIWLGFTFYGFVNSIILAETTAFIPLVMFVFGWLLSLGGFWLEFPRTLREFKLALE